MKKPHISWAVQGMLLWRVHVWIRHTTHAGKSPSLFCGFALKALEVALEASRKPLSIPGGTRNDARMPELEKTENSYPKFCSNQWSLRLNPKAHVCRWIQNCSCSRVKNEAGMRAMRAGGTAVWVQASGPRAKIHPPKPSPQVSRSHSEGPGWCAISLNPWRVRGSVLATTSQRRCWKNQINTEGHSGIRSDGKQTTLNLVES